MTELSYDFVYFKNTFKKHAIAIFNYLQACFYQPRILSNANEY